MSDLTKKLEKFVQCIELVTSPPPKGPSFPEAKVVTIDGSGEIKDELNENHVVVQDQVGSTIYLNACPASLKVSKLTNCKIICGRVHTSILVEYCRNCVFFLCGNEIRISNSAYIDMYFRVESRTTIEDSTNIRFAPYYWNDERSPNMTSLAHFDLTVERFDQIEDFNWLAFSTPSPNWTTIPDIERTEFPEAELPEVEDEDNEEEETLHFSAHGDSQEKSGVTFNGIYPA